MTTLSDALTQYDAADEACQAATTGPAFRTAEGQRREATIALAEAVRAHITAQPDSTPESERLRSAQLDQQIHDLEQVLCRLEQSPSAQRNAAIGITTLLRTTLRDFQRAVLPLLTPEG